MTRIYRATAESGLITVDNVDVPDAVHQTGGQGRTEGMFLVDGDRNVYIPIGTAADLLGVIDAVEALLSLIIKVPPVSPIPPPAGYPTNLIGNGTLLSPDKGLAVNELMDSLQSMRERLR